MKINVVSTKLVKPRTPTPQSLSKYKISFTDEFGPPMNVRILLFYRISQSKQKIICSSLEESLAQTLSRFYPLAGRYVKADHLIDCSDQGAEFIEADAVDVESMSLVEKMEPKKLNHLLSRKFYEADEAATLPLLSIQATHFKCGGLAIGVSVSHRIFDGESLETFVLAWSECNAAGSTAITPSFDSPELLPRGDLDCTRFIKEPEIWNDDLNICVKRFLFTNEAINSLRQKCGVINVSRVRVVCAVVVKAMVGVDRARHGRSRPCLAAQAFNLRKRTSPPLPKHACGNLSVQSITRCMVTENVVMTAGELVGVLGEAVGETTSECSRILSVGVEGLHEIIVNPVANAFARSSSGEANVVWLSDWSKFKFNKVDFGFGSGKPEWVSIGPVAGENMTILMESKEGSGIEAWVHLNSNDMPNFHQDNDIRLLTKCVMTCFIR